MLVIPAIDLYHGHCVRHRPGGCFDDEQDYYVEPLRMAKLWRVMNAQVLHLADIDAAHTAHAETRVDNRAAIERIVRALDIPVEVGGGIRSLKDVEALLEIGVYRVVLGTAAVTAPHLVEEAVQRFGARRIVVGIDAHDGAVVVRGRSEEAGVTATDLALDMEARGVRRFVYTDTDREGTLQGPNVAAYRRVAEQLTQSRVTAAGGVGGYTDLLALQPLEPMGVDSVVVGRALYENRFPCQQFWCWHQKETVDLDRYSTASLKR